LPADNSQDSKANGTSAHSTTLQTDDTIISKVVDDTIATNTSSIETLVNQELITAINSSLEIKTQAPDFYALLRSH
jgi:hypothetical protein